jgi:hypothetical protein
MPGDSRVGLRALTEDPEIIGIAGDWHGDLTWALQIVETAHRWGLRILLQVGDLGYDWLPTDPDFEYCGDPATARFIQGLDRKLAEYDMLLLWLEGNHDNREALQARPVHAVTGTQPITPRIHHLPRGYRWVWADSTGLARTWMALGGAVSMDREDRPCSPLEAISYSEARHAIEPGQVDVLLTHDVPAGVAIPGINGRGHWPLDVFIDAEQHRALLRAVVDEVRPAALFHGHMHCRYDAGLPLSGAGGSPARLVEVHGLDCNDRSIEGNLVLADAAGRLLCPDCRHLMTGHDDGEGCLHGWGSETAGCGCLAGIASPRPEAGTLDLLAMGMAAGGGTGFRRRPGADDGRWRRNR